MDKGTRKALPSDENEYELVGSDVVKAADRKLDENSDSSESETSETEHRVTVVTLGKCT